MIAIDSIVNSIENAKCWLVDFGSSSLQKAKLHTKLYYLLGLYFTARKNGDLVKSNTAQSITSVFSKVMEQSQTFSAREAILALMVCCIIRNYGIDPIAFIERIRESIRIMSKKEKLDLCDHYLLNLLLEKNGVAWEKNSKEIVRRSLLSQFENTFVIRDNPLSISNLELLALCKSTFALTEYGTRELEIKNDFYHVEKYLRYLTFYHIKNRDIEVVSTLLQTLKYLRLDSFEEYTVGVEYLLDNQNTDGSFGLFEIELNFNRLETNKSINYNEDIYLPVTVLSTWVLANRIKLLRVI